MSSNGCVAMILAGGRGERLGALTRFYPKPAVHFGGKNRIIDFTLNNCARSGLSIIGILSQYLSNDLHGYVSDKHKANDGIYMLPPKSNDDSYSGTGDAVYKNIDFIDRFQTDCVLVLAGDHIYDMDYSDMIAFHQKNNADVTIASTRVNMNEASRFGIINAGADGRVQFFEEKPLFPKSNLASMGIYVFNWRKLKSYLMRDGVIGCARNDFGKDILPDMLSAGESMFTFRFNGYWRDVGTIGSLWEANMDQIDNSLAFEAQNRISEQLNSHRSGTRFGWRHESPHHSIVSEMCSVSGWVEHSVLFDRVMVEKGAEIVDSVIMPGAYIGRNTRIHKSIVGAGAIIMDGATVGTETGSDFFLDHKVCTNGVSLIAPWLQIEEGMCFQAGSHIYEERLREWITCADPIDSEDSFDRDENRRGEYARSRVVSV